MIGLIMLPSLRDFEASLVPVIYPTNAQRLTLQPPVARGGHFVAESCTSIREPVVRLLTLGHGTYPDTLIALGALEC